MRSFEKKLRGFVYRCDEKYVTLYILADEIAEDTNKFLKSYFVGQNKTITRSTFKVKMHAGSCAHLDKARQSPTAISNLVGQVVEVNVTVAHYNFIHAGEKITGWNMRLLEMHPI